MPRSKARPDAKPLATKDHNGGKKRARPDGPASFETEDFDAGRAIQVREDDGSWKDATLYRRKGTDTVCLWFGGEEYEGLDGAYLMVGGVVFDGDNVEVKTRRLQGRVNTHLTMQCKRCEQPALARNYGFCAAHRTPPRKHARESSEQLQGETAKPSDASQPILAPPHQPTPVAPGSDAEPWQLAARAAIERVAEQKRLAEAREKAALEEEAQEKLRNGVVVKQVGAGAACVEWESVPGVAYRLKYSRKDWWSAKRVECEGGSVRVDGLEVGVAYRFSVAVSQALGYWSEEVELTIGLTEGEQEEAEVSQGAEGEDGVSETLDGGNVSNADSALQAESPVEPLPNNQSASSANDAAWAYPGAWESMRENVVTGAAIAKPEHVSHGVNWSDPEVRREQEEHRQLRDGDCQITPDGLV